MTITVRKLNGALGARVEGASFGDGRSALDLADVTGIEAALYEHSVIAVSAASMSPAQHLALARHFGEPEHHQFFPNLGPGLEEVTLLDSERDRSNMWHMDEPFLERPPIITMTHAQRLPSYGGDTEFISLHAAYDDLSPRMQGYIEGLSVAPRRLLDRRPLVDQGPGRCRERRGQPHQGAPCGASAGAGAPPQWAKGLLGVRDLHPLHHRAATARSQGAAGIPVSASPAARAALPAPLAAR